MIITDIVFNVLAGTFNPILINRSVNLPEKLSAAKALPKNPANVIPT